MAKVLADIELEDGGKGVVFFCPGCGYYHHFIVAHGTDTTKPLWTWNESYEKPTFSPSIAVNMSTERPCHSFVRDGKIQYLGDCTHDLRGQTVDMKAIEW